ncbi:alkene reductase [Echinimonas agarilytica]|uniref:Alkene reductase n=1 Tax=Echinimonas agarilytica TaxID=1215918 RepID=A0AA42B707_9GAMM|nr:alkene reductase [Echinimonas agarilytica]MCM2679372.1 alkene reductase [Echinimonas agarilytica]
MSTDILFEKYTLNSDITLKNRLIMAPMTRCMATDKLVPTPNMAEYYARRADCGLIISEATIISPEGQGYINTPGIFSAEQIAGWKLVTQKVHEHQGKIFCQLWHCGRVAHSHFSGHTPYAPSPLGVEGSVPRMREATYEVPVEATDTIIEGWIEAYAQGAKNAVEAGFDGVEIHGANGYLIDQFLHYASNVREDLWGGSAENMARFALAVVDRVVDAVGAHKVGLRLSPGAYFNMDGDERDRAVFDYLLMELDKRSIAYLHVGVFDDAMTFEYLGGSMSAYMRSHSAHTLVGVGSYTAATGREAVQNNQFDLLGIGRPMIANPYYATKIQKSEAIVDYNEAMLAELN